MDSVYYKLPFSTDMSSYKIAYSKNSIKQKFIRVKILIT